jgi:hypothetical protein
MCTQHTPEPQKGWQRKTLQTFYDGPVYDLYDGRPFHCKQDGQRFTTQAELDKHLDLLFQVNIAVHISPLYIRV